MRTVSHNLPGRSCAPGKSQAGFTLPEMLVALAVIALLAVTARPMLQTSLLQLRYLTQATATERNALPQALQWLENDILQIRADRPWHWEGTPDGRHCLVRWRFDTENVPYTQGLGVVRQSIQYRVEGSTLLRDTLQDGKVDTSQPLLGGVRCLQPAFWQGATWRNTPRPGITILALKLSLTWQGSGVVRIWPVDLTYAP